MSTNTTPPNGLKKDDFVGYYRAYTASRQNQADEGTETARICKSAKEKGVDVDAMRAVDRLRKMDALRRESYLENLCVYLDWAGIPNQLRFDLSGAMTTSPREGKEKAPAGAFDQGKEQGLAGTFDPPYEKGTIGFADFYKGWLEGQRENAGVGDGDPPAEDAPEETGDDEGDEDGEGEEGDDEAAVGA